MSGVVVSRTAAVTGGRRYRVRLALEDSRLVGTCTCPVGAEGAFCKHCVATAPAVSAEHDSDSLRVYLSKRPHDELVELLLDALARDDVLRDRVRRSMEGSAEALARAIDDAAIAPEYVTWGEARAHAERLDGVLDALAYHADADGPMLRTGFQGFHGAAIALPRRPEDRPDRSRLESRFDRFARAAA